MGKAEETQEQTPETENIEPSREVDQLWKFTNPSITIEHRKSALGKYRPFIVS